MELHRGVFVRVAAVACAVALAAALRVAAKPANGAREELTNGAGGVPPVFATVLDYPAWLAAESQHRNYAPAAFAKNGFIHCSTLNQTTWVLNRFYGANTSAPTALIETARVTAPIDMVNSVPGMKPFPHIMGTLNLDAVPRVVNLTRPSVAQPWAHDAVCAALGGCS